MMHFANRLSSAANVTVLFSAPWPVRVYFHALTARLTTPAGTTAAQPRDCLTLRSLRPSEDRGRPAQLELAFPLAPGHALTLTLPFERVFLHFAYAVLSRALGRTDLAAASTRLTRTAASTSAPLSSRSSTPTPPHPPAGPLPSSSILPGTSSTHVHVFLRLSHHLFSSDTQSCCPRRTSP